MNIFVYNHTGKANRLIEFLEKAGCTRVERLRHADALFIDVDVPWAEERMKLISGAQKFRLPIFQYPHGGNPLYFYDGLCEPSPAVTAMLVTGPGHIQFQRRFHTRPVKDIGWFLCPMKEFHPTEIRNVLFAPIHPWYDGRTILKRHREANIRAYEAVLGLGLPVTVRYIGEKIVNGVYETPGVSFVQGNLIPATKDIDEHDLIVAADTFASLALARGKPVVMLGQNVSPAHDDGTPVSSWETYRNEVRYPLDVDDAPLCELADRALEGEGQEWKRKFVGTACTSERLYSAMKEFVDG